MIRQSESHQDAISIQCSQVGCLAAYSAYGHIPLSRWTNRYSLRTNYGRKIVRGISGQPAEKNRGPENKNSSTGDYQAPFNSQDRRLESSKIFVKSTMVAIAGGLVLRMASAHNLCLEHAALLRGEQQQGTR